MKKVDLSIHYDSIHTINIFWDDLFEIGIVILKVICL